MSRVVIGGCHVFPELSRRARDVIGRLQTGHVGKSGNLPNVPPVPGMDNYQLCPVCSSLSQFLAFLPRG